MPSDMKPFFAKGKDLERGLLTAVAVGSASFPVASAEDFAIGDRIFISETDGSLLEYLGLVQSAGQGLVSGSRSLKSAKSATALFWRARRIFQWERLAKPLTEAHYNQGLVVERSLNGQLWPVQVADPRVERFLDFDAVSQSHFDTFLLWTATEIRSGLDAFTWVDSTFSPSVVRLLSTDFHIKQTAPQTSSLRIVLDIEVAGGFS